MSNIKYVIRHNDFAYNDEWYQTDEATLGSIKAIYTDKAEAEQAYKSLVIHALYNFDDLSQFDIGNGYASDELYEKLEQFIFEKTGQEFETDDELPELNEDDAFEFAKLSGILHYQLIEVDDSQPNYVIWLNQDEAYFGNYDTDAIVFGSNEDFIETNEFDWYFLQRISTTLNGTLSELSDSPEILETFLKTAIEIHYSAEKSCLEINGNSCNYQMIKALNALLKQPLFEIRQVTLEELANL